MNIVDYVVLGVLGLSILFGFYRGFVSTVLNSGGCLVSLILSFILYPKAAALIQGNQELVRTLLHYTDASSRLGDLELALTNVATLTQNKIAEIVAKVQLPPPLDTLLQVNLEQQVYGINSGIDTVADYVSQTILTACINIICFLLCFALIYLALALLVNMLKAIFRFPVLKQLDWLAGGIFGFLRGVVICYAVFALVPLVQTVVPIDMIAELFEQSTLAPIFNNGNLILGIMNGRL
ncbi:MAG: CvpA family protein [Clostridia bacterium]|nr:CvpA family protein [Clostridia bacterium]MBQ7305062.1 CvpA family protein [Clostridia bacterium]